MSKVSFWHLLQMTVIAFTHHNTKISECVITVEVLPINTEILSIKGKFKKIKFVLIKSF